MALPTRSHSPCILVPSITNWKPTLIPFSALSSSSTYSLSPSNCNSKRFFGSICFSAHPLLPSYPRPLESDFQYNKCIFLGLHMPSLPLPSSVVHIAVYLVKKLPYWIFLVSFLCRWGRGRTFLSVSDYSKNPCLYFQYHFHLTYSRHRKLSPPPRQMGHLLSHLFSCPFLCQVLLSQPHTPFNQPLCNLHLFSYLPLFPGSPPSFVWVSGLSHVLQPQSLSDDALSWPVCFEIPPGC